jgi:glycine betaine/proline transport system ATP-binding protein
MDSIANLETGDLQEAPYRQPAAGRRHVVWSLASLLWGPVVFLRQERPIAFAAAVSAEVSALALLCGALPGGLGIGLLVLLAARSAAAATVTPRKPLSRIEIAAIVLAAAVYALILARVLMPVPDSPLFQFPKNLGIAPAAARIIDGALDWLALTFAPAFAGITYLARFTLQAITDLLAWIPWPVFVAAGAAAGWWAGGARTAAIAVGGILYVALFGYWDKAIATMALVGSAVALSTILGLPLGVLLGKSPRATQLVTPLMDAMQTLPSFVYLIPAVAFFSVGKPPAVLATVIVALPLMVRLTALGIGQVSADVREAAALDGASSLSSLLRIELPLASRSILLGFNQTVMASLSMVVVAALIGAGGLGFDVLQALNNVQSGNGVLAGLAIVICAVVPDRILQAAIRRYGIGQAV